MKMAEGIKIPWWIPHAYADAREQGFEGNLSTFVHALLINGFIDRQVKTNKAKRDMNSTWHHIKERVKERLR